LKGNVYDTAIAYQEVSSDRQKVRDFMKKQLFKIRLLPVIAFTAVVLLLVKADMYSMDIGYYPDLSINSTSSIGDFFCLIKADACFYISIWAFLTLLYILIRGQMKLKKTILYIPMAIYTVSVLMSFAFSDYKLISWYGSINRFEGTKTILCYMFMLFYTINVVEETKDAICVLIPILVTVFIANIIGISQLIGKDILFGWISKFIVEKGLNIEAEFKPGQVYQTVYNMNYVGMYLALLVPLLIWILFEGISMYKNRRAGEVGLTDNKLLAIVILAGVLLLMIVLNVYGADSSGGVIGIGAGIMAMIISVVDKKTPKIILTVFSITVFGTVLLTMYFVGEDKLVCIDYFETGENFLKTSIDGNEFTIEFDKETKEYTVIDEEGNLLEVSVERGKQGRYQIDDERFLGKLVLIPVESGGNSILCFGVYKTEFQFKMDGDEVAFINPYYNLVSLDKVESVGFKGNLSSGSGRGYIWSRTIPLIKKRLIFGSGADTFMMVFPQNDYAGKYSSDANLDTIYDKPHNMYLQMIVCTGGISCIAFIIMIIMFIIKSMKQGKEKNLPILIASGIFGFLIAGLFNDSTVCTMPLFYGLLGVGISQTES